MCARVARVYLTLVTLKSKNGKSSVLKIGVTDVKKLYVSNKIKLFRTVTEHSYFFTCKGREKRFKPITVDDIRYKFDMETGESRLYKKTELLASERRSVDRSYLMLRELLDMNDFDWFVTLTFDNLRLDRNDNEEVYLAYKTFIRMLSRKYPALRYISVPEKHESGALHFHLLMSGLTPKQLGFVDSGKVCCSWSPKNKVASKEYFERTKGNRELTPTDGLPIYNVTKFCYGFSTATRIASRERCNWYVQKYLDKAFGSTDLFKKRFFYSSNLVRKSSVNVRTWEYGGVAPLEMMKGSIEELLADGKVYVNREYNYAKAILSRADFELYTYCEFVSAEELDNETIYGEEMPFEEEYEYGKHQ